MSPETRERLRECLDESDGRMAVDRLLQIVEEAAEEARASERERVFKAIRASLIDDATTAQQMSWNEGIYHAAALASWTDKPAPPSPEPERAPPDVGGHTLRFPNERFEAQSGNPQPAVYDWTPKQREPEALTERGFRQIGEAHNALVTRVEALEFWDGKLASHLEGLAGRVEALEGTVAGIPEARALALEKRVEALESAGQSVPDKVSTYVRAVVEGLEDMKRELWEATAEEAKKVALESWGRLASLKARHGELERRLGALEAALENFVRVPLT